MRRSIVAALAAALALGGAAVAFAGDSSKKLGDADGVGGEGETVTAVAVPGGPPMVFHDGPMGPDGSFAEDLAAELGLSTEEVEQAMEAVAEKHRTEAQQQMAETLSEHLDGVGVEEIQAALAVAEEQMQQAIENGEPPEPDQFAATLAEELGLSEDEISEALTEMREDAFPEFRKHGLEERFGDEIPKALREGDFPPPPPGGPGVSFAFPTG